MSRRAVDTRGKEKVGTRRLFGRILFSFVVILLAVIGLVARIIYLNQEKGTTYEKKVLAQQSYSSKEINYKRGEITDRNGNKLAVSKKVYDLVLDPYLIRSKQEYIDATAKALSKVPDDSRHLFLAYRLFLLSHLADWRHPYSVHRLPDWNRYRHLYQKHHPEY